MIAYKFLSAEGTSVFTGFAWPLPNGGPGPWVQAPVDPCRTGLHACRREDLPYWPTRALFEVELAGEIVAEPTKVVASRARMLRRIDTWDDARDAYTRMCADRAHELARSTTPALEAWEAVVEPSIPEGPALLGFVAARVAEEASGPQAYRAERVRQARWLTDRLGL